MAKEIFLATALALITINLSALAIELPLEAGCKNGNYQNVYNTKEEDEYYQQIHEYKKASNPNVENLIIFLSEHVLGSEKPKENTDNNSQKIASQDAYEISLIREIMNDGEYDRAISRYESLLDKYPDSEKILNFIGYAYSKGGNQEKAIEVYSKILLINPHNCEALHNLALAAVAKYGKDAEPIVLLAADSIDNKKNNNLEAILSKMKQEP